MRVVPKREMLEYLDSIGVKPPVVKATPAVMKPSAGPAKLESKPALGPKVGKKGSGCLVVFLAPGLLAIAAAIVRMSVPLAVLLSLGVFVNTGTAQSQGQEWQSVRPESLIVESTADDPNQSAIEPGFWGRIFDSIEGLGKENLLDCLLNGWFSPVPPGGISGTTNDDAPRKVPNASTLDHIPMVKRPTSKSGNQAEHQSTMESHRAPGPAFPNQIGINATGSDWPSNQMLAFMLCCVVFLFFLYHVVFVDKGTQAENVRRRSFRGEFTSQSPPLTLTPAVCGEYRRQNHSGDLATATSHSLPIRHLSQWRTGVYSCKGNVRRENQDHAAVFEVDGCQVLLVADGCGGVAYGAEASQHAVETACKEVLWKISVQRAIPAEALRSAFEAASRALTEKGKQLKLNTLEDGLRTTLLIVIGTGSEFHWGYIGDGAMKIIKPNGVVRHCMVPHRSDAAATNVLSASLGPTTHGNPEFGIAHRNSGDILMLGTDGVFDRVNETFNQDVVRMAIFQDGDLNKTAKAVLDQLAKEVDSTGTFVCDDNLTLGIMADGSRPVFSPQFWKNQSLAFID